MSRQRDGEAGAAAGSVADAAGVGEPGYSQGPSVGDFDGDGFPDLYVSNYGSENFLYHNNRNGTFTEAAEKFGLTKPLMSFPTWFFDYDNDGDPDLFLANGHPDDMVETQAARVKYKEPLVLFENINGKYKNVSAQSGEVFKKDFPARGASFGDFDNDGLIDILVVNNGDAPALIRNQGGSGNNWIGLNLVSAKGGSNPGAVGAMITWTAGGVKRARLKTSGGSYLASHDPREVLGIGKAAKIDSIEIKWPSGKVDKLTNPPINQYIKVVEGESAAKK